MGTTNLLYRLRKINRGLSFNLWRVRIGGVEMALFFLFAIGEKLVGKFIPMEPETAHIVSETMSFISVMILGEAIMRSLFKLLPRYRWATLMAMASGAEAGLLITIIMDYFDKEVAADRNDLIALGVVVVLDIAAYLFWRAAVRRAKRTRWERSLAKQQRR